MSYDPRQPYWAPPPNPYAPPETPFHQRWWPYALLAGLLVVIGSASAFAYDRGLVFKDSGVAACEAMRDGSTLTDGEGVADTTLTEAEYRELREVFADSRHEDIRDHGTKLLDVVWQMTQVSGGEDVGMAALAYMGPLTEHSTGLQSACADQGVIVSFAK